MRDAAVPSEMAENWECCTMISLYAGPGRPARAAWIPHPSGRNRWYNEENNEEVVREFLGRLVCNQLHKEEM